MKINDLLKAAIENKASDIHLKVGNYPVNRIDGELISLTEFSKLTAHDSQELANQIMTDYQKNKLAKELDVDFAYSFENFGRFRGNIYHQQGTLAIVLRVVPLEIKTIKELLLPEILEKIALEKRGLVLVTGATGSGKSTTIASMMDHINTSRKETIITVEDPIEYVYKDKESIISQREVGIDVQSFSRGLRAALREDPDVVLVGEMRDLDTIETALLAAETGHLIFSTLHTVDAPETINRIISAFPPHQQGQVRLQLSSIIKAVISQRLIPTKDEKGRIAALEIMINTPYIQECIREKEKTILIKDSIAQGASQYGMQTFDQSIYKLYQDELISFEDGLKNSSNPDDFKLRVSGIESSTDMALGEMQKEMSQSKEAK